MADKKELIYSQQADAYVEGRAYSNPRFFSTARSDVSKVFIVGDWPEIVAAYEAIGVPVERIDAEAVQADPLAEAGAPGDLAGQLAQSFPANPLDLDKKGGAGGSVDELDKLTVPKLKLLAASEEIDLGDATKSDDIKKAIRDARTAKAADVAEEA